MKQALLVLPDGAVHLDRRPCGPRDRGFAFVGFGCRGFIAVAGISVQNGVIMVEQFTEIMRNGKSLAVAVLDGAVSRLRPIIMTALMAGLGLLPAALSHGIGSETQRPFAVVIVGGIVSATLFTLLLLPMLFPVFGDEQRENGVEA